MKNVASIQNWNYPLLINNILYCPVESHKVAKAKHFNGKTVDMSELVIRNNIINSLQPMTSVVHIQKK
jgi:hypothetical protein